VDGGDSRRAGSLPAAVKKASAERVVPAKSPSGGGAPVGRLLREADKKVTRLQRQRDALHQALAGAVDHVKMTDLGNELATVQSALDEAEEEWLTLAEQAEAGR
jgi:ABC transporter C-terminal domain